MHLRGPNDLAQSMGHLGHPEHPEGAGGRWTGHQTRFLGDKTVAVLGPMRKNAQTNRPGRKMFILGSDYRFIRDGIKEKISMAKGVLDSVHT